MLLPTHMIYFLTEPPRATREIPMKRKYTVDQTIEKSRRGGSKINGGCGINTNVRRWSWTSMASYMHSGARMSSVWLHNSSTIVDLLPLLSPPHGYILLTTGELNRYDLLILSNLGIHVKKYSVFTRKFQGWSWRNCHSWFCAVLGANNLAMIFTSYGRSMRS